jgi:hypothetical protein
MHIGNGIAACRQVHVTSQACLLQTAVTISGGKSQPGHLQGFNGHNCLDSALPTSHCRGNPDMHYSMHSILLMSYATTQTSELQSTHQRQRNVLQRRLFHAVRLYSCTTRLHRLSGSYTNALMLQLMTCVAPGASVALVPFYLHMHLNAMMPLLLCIFTRAPVSCCRCCTALLLVFQC